MAGRQLAAKPFDWNDWVPVKNHSFATPKREYYSQDEFFDLALRGVQGKRDAVQAAYKLKPGYLMDGAAGRRVAAPGPLSIARLPYKTLRCSRGSFIATCTGLL